jgi:hypothetical protein
MARIPMGNFGQAVARPGPMVNVPQGDSMNRAVAQVGQVAGNIVDGMERQRLDERQAALQAADQQHRQELHDAKVARDGADRAQALVAMNGAKDKLADLHDEIAAGVLDGSVPKDKAEATFSERSRVLLGEVGSGIPDVHREIGMAELQGAAGRLANGVRKTVTTRDKQDVTAGISQILEFTQRQYKADPAKATEQAMATVDQLGPHSTLNPDQLAKVKQQWKEQAQYTTAFEMVSAGRKSPQALDAAEAAIGKLPDLDPQRRVSLLAQVDGYRSQIEARAIQQAQRAEVAASKRDREAGQAWGVLSGWAMAGKTADPQKNADLIGQLSGTPYAAAYRALVADGAQRTAAAMLPIGQQQAQLDSLVAQRNAGGPTQALDAEIKRREQVLGEARRDYQAEPLRAAAERGVIESVRPLNLTSLDGIAAGIGERVQQAQAVATRTGKAVSPLLSEEAGKVGEMLAMLAPADRSRQIASMAGAMPPGMLAAVAQQIDGKNRPLALEMALGSSKTASGRYAGELVARGAQAIKDKSIKEETGAEFGLRAQIAKEVGDSLPGKAREDVIDAARLMYLGQQAEGLSPSVAGVVGLAVGGSLMEHNGRRIPVPAGMDEARMASTLRAYPAASLKQQVPDDVVVLPGGRSLGMPEFLARLPDAQLEPAGMGRYAVRVGSGLAMSTAGRPIIIEVKP